MAGPGAVSVEALRAEVQRLEARLVGRRVGSRYVGGLGIPLLVFFLDFNDLPRLHHRKILFFWKAPGKPIVLDPRK